MVLKRCRWSFGSSGFTLRVKVCDSALTRDCRCVKSASVTRRLTTTSSSFAASFSSFERQSPLRWRLGLVDLCVPGQTSVRELQSSSKALQYDLKPDVPKSEGRTLFFDTHAIVRLLEEHGFTTPQAEVIVKVLVRTTSSNMDLVYSDMVTKVQQEIMLQQVMSKIATVKKDMVILEKSEFSTLLAENEKLNNQLLQLKVQLAVSGLTDLLKEDVMNKVRSDNILDMNLEKSSVKELKAMHDKKLLEARTEILGMIAEHDGHLTQTNMKIDTELAGLKTMLEAHKLDTIKYLAGSVFTCLTVVLGFYRIWM